MRKAASLAWSFAVLTTLGCHSAFVDAVVHNRTQQPVSLLELDYPSASFGTQTLAPGADFRYKFKVLGSGVTRLSWSNGSNKSNGSNASETTHQVSGPELQEGDEGTLDVTLEPAGVEWAAHFKNRAIAASLSKPNTLMMPK